MSEIIKEFCEASSTVVFRSNAYGSQLDKFMEFFEEARKDFPELKESDVRVVHFSGKYYAKTFGIEFKTEDAPDSYVRIQHLEYTY